MLQPALEYLKFGLSVIPCDIKTKRPTLSEWACYQQHPATAEEAARFWTNGQGIACIGGPVSGGLEFIDLDEIGIATEYKALLTTWGCADLFDRLVVEASQTKGRFHVAYRFEGEAEGNLVLARRPATEEELSVNPRDKHKARIETRGKGGYCIIAPTPGYSLKQHDWFHIPVISQEERDTLLAAARTFDLVPKDHSAHRGGSKEDGRVGDDYNQRASIAEILEPLGWVRARGRDLWVRPGKDPRKGHSASWNHNGNQKLAVFTSAAGIEPGCYDLFGLYARLHWDGDFNLAARAALKSGYGTPSNKPAYVRPQANPTIHAERTWFTFDQKEIEEIEWLIEPYIPLGIGYTFLYGESDHGKSTALLNMVAELSNGRTPVSGKPCEPVRSIILSAEDSAAHVVKPRLAKFGANMKNIMAPEEFLPDGTSNPMTLDDIGAEELMERVRSFNAKLIIIDPLTAYFDGDNINDRLQARTFTRRLTNIAIVCKCAPVLTHHVNKSTGMQGRHRAAGSQDFFDASRSALMAVRGGPESADYALSHEKHNLTTRGDSLGYQFSKERGFEWTGASDLTSSVSAAALEEHVPASQLTGCTDWILEQLDGGPMLANDLRSGAKIAGYSYATYKRATSGMRDRVKMYKGKAKEDPWYAELRDFGGYGYGGDDK